MIFIKLASIIALLSTSSHVASVKVIADHEDKGTPKLLRGSLDEIAITSDAEQGVDDGIVDTTVLVDEGSANKYLLLKDRSSGVCPPHRYVPKVDCLDAAMAVGANHNQLVVGSWGYLPCGCSIWTWPALVEGGTPRYVPHFNTAGTCSGSSPSSLGLVCTDYHNEDITIWNGDWGGWKPWKKATQGGMYACGAQMRFEDYRGDGKRGEDDTAANGLKLKFCGLGDWRNQQEETIWDGTWGGWKAWAMCPYGKYIGGARVRYEDSIGDGDDTALNGLAVWCVDKDGGNGEEKVVYSGLWGGWKPWVRTDYKLVEKASVRFEDSIGDGDDTAMNGIQFNVEIPNFGVSNSQITGEWVNVASGPQGGFSHTISESTETTRGTELTKEEEFGFEESITAGFDIKVVNVELSATASQTFRTAETMSRSLSVYKGLETEWSCPDSGSPTGIYFLWQFKMWQPQDAYGNGFTSFSKDARCTPYLQQPPRCSVGNCAEPSCQKCLA